MTPTLLAIGTTHPLNIAGLGLDARAAAQLGVWVVTIVAGISAQDAGSVIARRPVELEMIRAQFRALADVPVHAIHIGALLDAGSVETVAAELCRFRTTPVVCDPVIAASGGGMLADRATIAALREALFAHCTLVTPNLAEAEALVGRPVADLAAMCSAARELRGLGPGAVLVKGGHLAGKPIDVLVTAAGETRYSADRLPLQLRGTGDLLACAIAARLAHGDELQASIASARAFVRRCLAGGVEFAGARTIP